MVGVVDSKGNDDGMRELTDKQMLENMKEPCLGGLHHFCLRFKGFFLYYYSYR